MNNLEKFSLIYILQEQGTNYYKIGVSTSATLEQRIRTISTGNPRQLNLVAVYKTSTIKEAYRVEGTLKKQHSYRNEWIQGSSLTTILQELNSEPFLEKLPEEQVKSLYKNSTFTLKAHLSELHNKLQEISIKLFMTQGNIDIAELAHCYNIPEEFLNNIINNGVIDQKRVQRLLDSVLTEHSILWQDVQYDWERKHIEQMKRVLPVFLNDQNMISGQELVKMIRDQTLLEPNHSLITQAMKELGYTRKRVRCFIKDK